MKHSGIKILAALALAAITAATAVAQDKYPSRSIEMVIPTAPGGGTDIALRQLAALAEPALGQSVVILNKTGAGGTIGVANIVNAKPDGYTIGGVWNAPLTMAPHMMPAQYKPSDYLAVVLVTWAPMVLCVKAAFPANDGKSFIEELKKNPGKYSYGNDGVGGTLHLASERVFYKFGVKALPVPFAGAGETLKSFLGGHIDIYAGSIPPILPYVKDKSAKCLLVTSPKRNPYLPDASSLTDLGVPQEATVLWRGIIAPKGVPPDRIAVLQKAFAEAALSPKFKAFMEERGEEVRGTGSPEFRQLVDGEYAAMGQVMEEVGLVKK